jgi:hypothetical protein
LKTATLERHFSLSRNVLKIFCGPIARNRMVRQRFVLMTPGHFNRMAAKPTIPVSACRALNARATRKNMLSESAAIP